MRALTILATGCLVAAVVAGDVGCRQASSADDGPTTARTAYIRSEKMKLEKEILGKGPDGSEIEQFTLINDHGLKVKVMSYGATLTSVQVPDRDGKLAEVTLNLDSLEDYLAGHPCLGSVCGRFANRIAKGKFTLDGQEYTLAVNNGPNHLHGGKIGFNKVVWTSGPAPFENSVGVTFTYHSRDGEEGYPGNLTAKVTYSLTGDDELRIEYVAMADKATPINLTNHAYWNLGGIGSGSVLNHQLMLKAARFLPVDDTQIPVGRLDPVAGTPMDFTEPKSIGSRIEQVPGGYDHCFVVDRQDDSLVLAGRLSDPSSGRVMEVYTTQPGVQVYTANGLNRQGAGGVEFRPHDAVCLETQHFPDSPNQPQFPSTILRPKETFREVTVYKFLVEK